MTKVMYEKDGVGLAANQVGVLKRFIVVDAGDGPIKIINPEIVHQSEETASFEEGCLSLPDIQIKLNRPVSVLVKGRNLQNQPVEYRAEGLLARVFQHEIDHLNGVLIIDRASSIQRSLLKSKLKRLEKQVG
jgi:peptide deformylase